MTQIRWEPAQSYPDPAIQTLDPRFDAIKPPFNAAVERLAGGLRWAEGPVWFGDGRYLLCSDIPNNRIMRWDEETGAIGVFRRPSHHANGNTRDRQGRLVAASMRRGGSPAPNMTGPSPSSSTASRASASIRQTTSSSIQTIRSGSPTRPSGSWELRGRAGISRAAHQRLPGRRQDRRRRNRRRRPQRTQRAVLSPDEAKLYVVESRAAPRRIGSSTSSTTASARQRTGVRQRRRGHPGRVSLRCRRAICGAAGE